jgi:hypothetical protein
VSGVVVILEWREEQRSDEASAFKKIKDPKDTNGVIQVTVTRA